MSITADSNRDTNGIFGNFIKWVYVIVMPLLLLGSIGLNMGQYAWYKLIKVDLKNYQSKLEAAQSEIAALQLLTAPTETVDEVSISGLTYSEVGAKYTESLLSAFSKDQTHYRPEIFFKVTNKTANLATNYRFIASFQYEDGTILGDGQAVEFTTTEAPLGTGESKVISIECDETIAVTEADDLPPLKIVIYAEWPGSGKSRLFSTSIP